MAAGQQGQMGKMQTNAQKLQQYPTGASQLMAGAKGVTPYTPQTFNTPPPVGGVVPGPPGGVTIPGGALPPRGDMGGGEAPGRPAPGGIVPGPPGGVTIPGGVLPPRGDMGGGAAPGRTPPGQVLPGPPGGVTFPGSSLPPRGVSGPYPGGFSGGPTTPDINVPIGPAPLGGAGGEGAMAAPMAGAPPPYQKPGGDLAARLLQRGIYKPTPQGTTNYGKLTPGGLPPRV